MLKKNRKKGFTLVEVIVALTVIVIVSAAAITIILSSFAAKTKVVSKSCAQNFASNVWECFKAADTQEEFVSMVSFSEGVELSDAEKDDEGRTVYTCIFDGMDLEARISVEFSATERDELEIDITDDGESIISFSYRKGDET